MSLMDQYISNTLERVLGDPVLVGTSSHVLLRRLSMIITDVKNMALTLPTQRLIWSLAILQEGVQRYPISIDTTGGLQWLFYNTRASRSHEFPTVMTGVISRVNPAEYLGVNTTSNVNCREGYR